MRVRYLYEKDKRRVAAPTGAFDSGLIVQALKRRFPFRYRLYYF